MNFAFIFPPVFGVGFIFYFLPSIIALACSKRNTVHLSSELLPRLDARRMGRCLGESGRFSSSGSLGEQIAFPLVQGLPH